jgi:hypothetical protein
MSGETARQKLDKNRVGINVNQMDEDSAIKFLASLELPENELS